MHQRPSPMELARTAAMVVPFLLAAGLPCQTQEAEAEAPPSGPQTEIDWVVGPATGDLGGVAEVDVPEGFVFAGPDDTRKLMESMENPVNGSERGFLARQGENWFVVFEFSETGYVKDDEKAELDADAILESLREGNRHANEIRRERGWEVLELTGWFQPPHYDGATHNLEWATRASSSGGESINYNTRLLGRRGVMSATLVGGEAEVRDNMAVFKSLLGGHRFVSGEDYAAFRPGDKIAQYGLTALITGGAAAAAVKTGLFKKFWKLIVLGGAAGLAALRKLFVRGKKTGESGDATA